ncbi:MAG: hypothetical protein LBP92_15705 [Deltaproteobacteria bacterium]|nr:hypothetical protein [Deltaproteobacteria bacterium]
MLVACSQCDEAPCPKGCGAGALARDEATAVIAVEPGRRVGRRTFVPVCP